MKRPYAEIKKNLKTKIFIEEFVENGGNATRAIMKAKPKYSYETARVEASKELAKPSTKQSLKEYLEQKSFDNTKISTLLKRNAQQKKNLNASNSAIDMVLKVRGDYAPEKRLNVNLDVPNDLENAIKDTLVELQRLKQAEKSA